MRTSQLLQRHARLSPSLGYTHKRVTNSRMQRLTSTLCLYCGWCWTGHVLFNDLQANAAMPSAH